MKILYITTIGSTMGFFNEIIRCLIDDGNEVDIATNETSHKVPKCYREWGCKVYQISCSRTPVKKENLDAIKQIREIVLNNSYDLVHCHTPIAAFCARIACKSLRKNGVKVYYTAHGFHFFHGAPIRNWLLYYPIEKICSYYTDVLITINKEDYLLAKKKFHANKVSYIPGVGIDVKIFRDVNIDKRSKRAEIGVPQDVPLIISVGELNKNKNHETAIRAIKETNAYYIIAGVGSKRDELRSLINELGLQKRVKLLGFRNDIGELYNISDIFLFPSYREGLSVSLMEAMASGMPCVVSKIRGNVDLIDENGGVMFDPHSEEECAHAIQIILNKKEKKKMGFYNQNKIAKFDITNIIEQTNKVYSLY